MLAVLSGGCGEDPKDDEGASSGTGGTTSSGAGASGGTGGTGGTGGGGEKGGAGGSSGALSSGGTGGDTGTGGSSQTGGSAGSAGDPEGGDGGDDPSPVSVIVASATEGDAPLTVDFEVADDASVKRFVWVINDIAGEYPVAADRELMPPILDGPVQSHTFELPGEYRVQLFTFLENGTVTETATDIRVGGLHATLTKGFGVLGLDAETAVFYDDGSFVGTGRREGPHPQVITRFDATGAEAWRALEDGDGVSSFVSPRSYATLGQRTAVLYTREDGDSAVGLLDADGALEDAVVVTKHALQICATGDEVVIVGSTQDEPLPGAEGSGNMFAMRLDAELAVRWTRLLTLDAPPRCVVDGAGNVAVVSDRAPFHILDDAGAIVKTDECANGCRAVAPRAEGFLVTGNETTSLISAEGEEEGTLPTPDALQVALAELDDGVVVFGSSGDLTLDDGERTFNRSSQLTKFDVVVHEGVVRILNRNLPNTTGLSSDYLSFITDFDTRQDALPGSLLTSEEATALTPFEWELDAKNEIDDDVIRAASWYRFTIIEGALGGDPSMRFIKGNGTPLGAAPMVSTLLEDAGFYLVNYGQDEVDGARRYGSLMAYAAPTPTPPGCSCETNIPLEGAHICTGGLEAASPACDACPAAYAEYSVFDPETYCSVDDVMYCCKAPAQGSFTYTYFYSDCTNCEFSELDLQCKTFGGVGLEMGPCALDP